MTKKKNIDMWSIGIFLIIFLVELILFYQIIIVADGEFRRLTSDYWNWWIMEAPHYTYDGTLTLITQWVRAIFGIWFVVRIAKKCLGVQIEQKVLQINIEFKKERGILWLILFAGILLYWPVFVYVRDFAKHYRLYMMLLPNLFLALVLLGILFAEKKFAAKLAAED